MPYIPKQSKRPWWQPERKPFENFNISPELRRFYQSKKWRELRRFKLARNPICEQCEAEGKARASFHCDHIKPIVTGREPWALELGNLRALCLSHHNRKTGKTGTDKKNAGG